MIYSRNPGLILPTGYVRLLKIGSESQMRFKYSEHEVSLAIAKLTSLLVQLATPPHASISATTLDLERVAASVCDLKISCGWLIGRFKILGTPFGNVIRQLRANKVNICLNVVGTGSWSSDFFVNQLALHFVNIEHNIGYAI